MEPKFLADLLSPVTRDFGMDLCNNDDPFCLHEPWTTGEYSLLCNPTVMLLQDCIISYQLKQNDLRLLTNLRSI